jgi:hypothetical protein
VTCGHPGIFEAGYRTDGWDAIVGHGTPTVPSFLDVLASDVSEIVPGSFF